MGLLDRPHEGQHGPSTLNPQAQDNAADENARLAIWRLSRVLEAQGMLPLVAESEPLLVVPGRHTEGHRDVEIRCIPRKDAGDGLWFNAQPSGQPGKRWLAEVTQLTNALVAVKDVRKLRI